MKTFDLKRVPPPPPAPEAKLCVACKGFRAECVVPVGESSAPMCWLCAHHVVDHERAPHDAATAECECLPHQVYPGREPPTVDELISERLRLMPDDVLLPGEPSFMAAVRQHTKEVIASMTRAQRIAFLNGGAPRSQAQYRRGGLTDATSLSAIAAVTQHGSRRKSS